MFFFVCVWWEMGEKNLSLEKLLNREQKKNVAGGSKIFFIIFIFYALHKEVLCIMKSEFIFVLFFCFSLVVCVVEERKHYFKCLMVSSINRVKKEFNLFNTTKTKKKVEKMIVSFIAKVKWKGKTTRAHNDPLLFSFSLCIITSCLIIE